MQRERLEHCAARHYWARVQKTSQCLFFLHSIGMSLRGLWVGMLRRRATQRHTPHTVRCVKRQGGICTLIMLQHSVLRYVMTSHFTIMTFITMMTCTMADKKLVENLTKSDDCPVLHRWLNEYGNDFYLFFIDISFIVRLKIYGQNLPYLTLEQACKWHAFLKICFMYVPYCVFVGSLLSVYWVCSVKIC